MLHKRRRRPSYGKPDLTVAQILAWADDCKRRIGRWLSHSSGRIRPTDETWLAINVALGRGNRGLPGGSSLANILYMHRGVRNPRNLPPLDEMKFLRWAQAHFRRIGTWPSLHDGAIHDAPGETWFAIDYALRRGFRGIRGGFSLSLFLAASGLKYNPKRLPELRAAKILDWADAFFARHHHWPSRDSGPVAEFPLDTWSAIDRWSYLVDRATGNRHHRRTLLDLSVLSLALSWRVGPVHSRSRVEPACRQL